MPDSPILVLIAICIIAAGFLIFFIIVQICDLLGLLGVSFYSLAKKVISRWL